MESEVIVEQIRGRIGKIGVVIKALGRKEVIKARAEQVDAMEIRRIVSAALAGLKGEVKRIKPAIIVVNKLATMLE